MSGAATLDQLHGAILQCWDHFKEVFATLQQENPETVVWEPLWIAWGAYYFGEFARFENLLQLSMEQSERDVSWLTSLCVSHHNLHRLMEVLEEDIGRGLLGSTHFPERVVDLLEVTSRLEGLLRKAATGIVAGGMPIDESV